MALTVTKHVKGALRIHTCNLEEGVGPPNHIIPNQAARIRIFKHGHSGLQFQQFSKLHWQVVKYPTVLQTLLTYTKESEGGWFHPHFQLWHQFQQTSADHCSS